MPCWRKCHQKGVFKRVVGTDVVELQMTGFRVIQPSGGQPRLIHGLPQTDNPAVWLLALMNRTDVPMRLRVAAAKAMLD